MSRPRRILIGAGLLAGAGLAAAALIAAGDGEGDAARRAPATSACERSVARHVPQPTATQLAAAGLGKLPLAPSRRRVDRVAPPFSQPTHVTNPLFPIGELHSAILNGKVDGRSFKTETTLLPGTRIMEWSDGQCVEVLVSQYLAYSGGRIVEVALDLYAQADDGSVWYLGEDVFNYEDGVIADTGGTWLAGTDGPAAMIMPGAPQAGDVYRPENIAGLVFEEVEVRAIGETVDGPRGPVRGAITVRELHDDGTFEEKVFAPGYGEFFTGSGGDVEALALAVPTDALRGAMPAGIELLSTGADGVFDVASARDWRKASATVEEMSTAWRSHRRTGRVPSRLEDPTAEALRALTRAVGDRDRAEARQSAIDVGQAGLDLRLQYRPVAEVDRGRFDLWLRQVIVDAEARDASAVAGDVAVLEWIRDRIARSLDRVDLTRVDTGLRELRTNAGEEDLEAAGRTAAAIRDLA